MNRCKKVKQCTAPVIETLQQADLQIQFNHGAGLRGCEPKFFEIYRVL